MVQDPADLGGREVGVGQQAGGGLDVVGEALGHQLVHQAGGAAALPDDGVVNGGAGGFVPDDGGFPLVGDADGRQVGGLDAALGHHLHHDGVLGGPDFHGVVLHPALFGVDLGEFLLADGDDILLLVEQDGPGTGGSLVQRENVFRHGMYLLLAWLQLRCSWWPRCPRRCRTHWG